MKIIVANAYKFVYIYNNDKSILIIYLLIQCFKNNVRLDSTRHDIRNAREFSNTK